MRSLIPFLLPAALWAQSTLTAPASILADFSRIQYSADFWPLSQSYFLANPNGCPVPGSPACLADNVAYAEAAADAMFKPLGQGGLGLLYADIEIDPAPWFMAEQYATYCSSYRSVSVPPGRACFTPPNSHPGQLAILARALNTYRTVFDYVRTNYPLVQIHLSPLPSSRVWSACELSNPADRTEAAVEECLGPLYQTMVANVTAARVTALHDATGAWAQSCGNCPFLSSPSSVGTFLMNASRAIKMVSPFTRVGAGGSARDMGISDGVYTCPNTAKSRNYWCEYTTADAFFLDYAGMQLDAPSADSPASYAELMGTPGGASVATYTYMAQRAQASRLPLYVDESSTPRWIPAGGCGAPAGAWSAWLAAVPVAWAESMGIAGWSFTDTPALTCQPGDAAAVPSVSARGTAYGAVAGLNIPGRGVPAAIAASSGDGQSTAVGQAFPTALAATVTDTAGAPVAGARVTFTVVPGATGAGGVFGTLGPVEATTDPSGKATAPVLNANPVAGPFTVTAHIFGLSATFAIANRGYTLGADSAVVGGAAGAGTVLLAGYGPWAAGSDAGWLHPAAAGGAGGAPVHFSYDANPSQETRTGTLTLAGLAFPVTQAGAGYVPVYPVDTLVPSGLSLPQAVAVDGQGNVYVADTGANAIKRWNAANGQVTVLVDSGLNAPAGLAVDSQGNVYIADSGNHAVKRWNAGTREVTTLVSSGLRDPRGLALDGGGNLFIADSGNHAVKEWNASSQRVKVVADSGLNQPVAVAVDARGTVYVADGGNHPILEWPAGGPLAPLAVPDGPASVAVDGLGHLYIADTGNHRLSRWDPATRQLTAMAVPKLNQPSGLAVDRAGNLYLADIGDSTVKKLRFAFVALGALARNESEAGGTDAVSARVLPAGTALPAVSDEPWLTTADVAGGMLEFEYSANTSGAARTGHIELAGPQVTVTQYGDRSSSTAPAGPPADIEGNQSLFTGGHAPATQDADAGDPVTIQEQCTHASSTCVPMASLASADPYNTPGGFSGYADPTIRQDPQTGTLWMAYSWVYVTKPGTAPPCPAGIQAVNTHLAYSTDHGATWKYQGALHTGTCGPDPLAPANNDLVAFEVANLLPQVISGTTWWYEVHSEYYLNGAGHNQVPGSQRWWLAACPDRGAGPMCLAAAAKFEYLGTPSTNAAGWPYAQNLSNASSAVSGCSAYFEPSLVLQGTELYLFLNCQNSSGALPWYAAFSAQNPAGNPDWANNPPQWSYTGGANTFATKSDAAGICGQFGNAGTCAKQAPFITQGDVVPCSTSATGVCFVCSEVTLNSGKVSLGCFTAEMASINPPLFVYASGAVKLDVVMTSPDSTPAGPGSCTYSPYATGLPSGMIMAHKETDCTGGASGCSAQGGFFTYLMHRFQAAPASQTISFGALSNRPYGTPPFAVGATATSGLAVSFASTTPAVCTVSGATVTLVAAGLCAIQAAQPGNTNYAPAPAVGQSFQVTQAGQTISFGALSNQPYGTPPFAVGATATSGLAVIFASTTPAVCTVSGATVTLAAAGLCTLQAAQPGNTNYAPAPPVGQSFQVTQAGQSIEFGTLLNRPYGAPPSAVGATATSGLAVSFASTTPAVCTVSGATVKLAAAGLCTIQAAQSGDTNYAPAPPVSQSFQVNQAGQSIEFGALSNRPYGTPFIVSATATSGMAVSFVSTTPAVCAVSAATVTLLAAGQCVLEASQVGGANYLPAPPVLRSFQILQPIMTTVSASPNPSVFGSPVTLSAALSPWPATGKVTFYANTTVLGAAPVSGGATLRATLAAGSASLMARYVDDGNTYALSASMPWKQTVQALPVTGFTATMFAAGADPRSAAAADFNGDGKADLAVANFAGNSVTVLLGDGSGGFTAAGGSPFAAGACPRAVAVGDFNEDGMADMAIANSSDNSVTVWLGDGSGGFTAASGSPFAVGASPISVAVGDFDGNGHADLAMANSGGGTVSVLLGDGRGGFTAASASPLAVGDQPSSLAVGDFNQDGNADLAVAHAGGDNVTVWLGNGRGGFTAASGNPFAVGRNPQALTVGDLNSDGKADLAVANSGDGSVTVLLGDGGGGFTTALASPFQVAGSPTSVAIVEFNGKADLAVAHGDAVTVLLGDGRAGFTPAGGSPFAAGSGAASLATGDFNGDGRADLAVADRLGNRVAVLLGEDPAAQLQVTQQPSSGTVAARIGDVVVEVQDAYGNLMPGSSAEVTIASTSSGVRGTLTETAVGGIARFSDLVFPSAASYTLTASAAGLTPGSSSSIQIAQASQSIAFDALPDQPFGAPPPAIRASATSGLAVSLTSMTPAVCMVSGAAVTLSATGTCTIKAAQTGDASYLAATPVNQSFQVTRASQTIVFGGLSNRTFGGAAFAINATATSGLPVSFASATAPVCTVSGGTVMLAGTGTCNIQATQAGSANYAAAAPVNQSFQVTQASQTIAFGGLSNRTFGAAAFAVEATATSGLAVSFVSATTPVCTMAGATVTLLAGGTCTVRATQAGNANYAAATPVNQSFQVTRASQTIAFGPLSNRQFGSAPVALSATATSRLAASFASATPSTCTVSGVTAMLAAAGTCTIRATQAGNASYAAAPAVSQSFQVTQAKQTIAFGILPGLQGGSHSIALSATATSGLAVSFASATPSICKVSGVTAILVGAGMCTIRATQAGNANYAAATPVYQSFRVTPAPAGRSYRRPD